MCGMCGEVCVEVYVCEVSVRCEVHVCGVCEVEWVGLCMLAGMLASCTLVKYLP